MQRFRGGIVFKAHRLCVSLNSRLEACPPPMTIPTDHPIERIFSRTAFEATTAPFARLGSNRHFQLPRFVPQVAGFRWAPVPINDPNKVVWSYSWLPPPPITIPTDGPIESISSRTAFEATTADLGARFYGLLRPPGRSAHPNPSTFEFVNFRSTRSRLRRADVQRCQPRKS